MTTNGKGTSGDPARPAQDVPTQAVPADATVPLAYLPRSDQAAFQPGNRLAERYRVIRFIARGGMGEVYEVEDLTLHGHLALKTIRPEIAGNAVAVERFKREINVARRITHPNVSRIFDIGIHRGTAETMFLTMELLPGDTLMDHLSKHGEMSEQEALPIAEQIAAGLAAAHAAGIIHRDFKSANVMLVPSAQGLRAVITDFGLARPAIAEDGMMSLSETGAVAGTPAYMAPEQVEGRELTPAADLYAFGIVLYEMVTGSRPFSGETPLSLAVKRLTDVPRPPRELIPTLDPVWNATILRCLERDPSARFASALEVAQALRSGELPVRADEMPTITQLPHPVSRAPHLKRAAGIAAAVILAAIAIYAFVFLKPASSRLPQTTSASSTGAPSVVLRPAVAVLGIRNTSGQPDAGWLSTAIAELLSADLASGEKVRLAGADEIARVKSDFAIAEPDSLQKDMLKRVQRWLDADSLVLGSFTLVGDPGSRLLRLDLRMVDATTGNVVASSTTSGTESQLADLVTRAGAALRKKLAAGDLTPAQSLEIEASIPSTPEAVRGYEEGIARLRSFDAKGAIDALTRAAAADAKHPLIRAALAEAYEAVGYDAKAKEEGQRAVSLAGRLNREQRLLVEARAHEASKNWEKAIEAERSLHDAFPDDLEYGLKLANAQISGDKSREALVTIDALRRLPDRISRDGRIDLAEAKAHQQTGDSARQKVFAVKAVAKGRAIGSRLLIANARLLEASALADLGDLAGVTAAVDEARTLFEATGDREGIARAVEFTAWVAGGQGDLEGEKKLFDQALSIHRAIGDEAGMARDLVNIGMVLVEQGRSANAETFFDQGLSTFRRIGDKYAAARSLNAVGAMMFNRGDLKTAERRYKEALSLFGELNEKTGTATALTNIGEVLECRGDLANARQMHEESLAISRAIGDKASTAYVLFRLGGIFAIRGEMVAARQRYEEALALQKQIGDKLGAADSRAALAGLSIDAGKAAAAESEAREAEEILRTEGATDRSVYAQAVVVDALLAERKTAEALKVADQAWQQASKAEDRRVRMKVAVSRARAMAASGQTDAALKFLESTIADASRTSFVVFEYEGRLAAAQIELAAGRPAAKKRLTTLEKEATARGFGNIARRAAAGSA